MSDKTDDLWQDFSRHIAGKEAAPFFERFYADMQNLYQTLNYPNGRSDENMWAWCYDQLVAARRKALAEEEQKRLELFKFRKQPRTDR